MTRILKSKYKIDRRLRCNLWGRPKSPFNRRDYPPGLNGQNKRKKPSDFGNQLMAKQKLKCHYGYITEKQFRNIFFKASKINLIDNKLNIELEFTPTVEQKHQKKIVHTYNTYFNSKFVSQTIDIPFIIKSNGKSILKLEVVYSSIIF